MASDNQHPLHGVSTSAGPAFPAQAVWSSGPEGRTRVAWQPHHATATANQATQHWLQLVIYLRHHCTAMNARLIAAFRDRQSRYQAILDRFDHRDALDERYLGRAQRRLLAADALQTSGDAHMPAHDQRLAAMLSEVYREGPNIDRRERANLTDHLQELHRDQAFVTEAFDHTIRGLHGWFTLLSERRSWLNGEFEEHARNGTTINKSTPEGNMLMQYWYRIHKTEVAVIDAMKAIFEAIAQLCSSLLEAKCLDVNERPSKAVYPYKPGGVDSNSPLIHGTIGDHLDYLYRVLITVRWSSLGDSMLSINDHISQKVREAGYHTFATLPDAPWRSPGHPQNETATSDVSASAVSPT